MKLSAVFLILSFLIPANAFAANTTTVLGYPSGQATNVCAPTAANNQCLGQGGGGSSQWTGAAPGDIYYNQGNVGIGTFDSRSLAQAVVIQKTSNNALWVENTSTGEGGYFQVDNGSGADAIQGYAYGDPSTGIFGFANDAHGIGISGEADTSTSVAMKAISTSGTGIYSQAPKNYFSGNVGVGSTNPGQAVDVQGTVRTTGFALTTGSSLNNKVLTADPSGNGTWQTASSGGANPGGSATNLQYQVDGTTFGGVANSSVDSNGNIGIGSPTPGTILDVQGTVRATQIKDTGITASKVVVTDANKQLTAATNLTDTAYSTAVGANPTATVGTAAVNGSAANFMRSDGAPAINLTMSPTWTGLHTFNNSPALVTGAGDNVGIGSATPGQALDVQGTARALSLALTNNITIGTTIPANTVSIVGSTGAQPIIDITDFNNVNSDTRLDLRHAEGTVGSPSDVADGDFLGGVRFSGYANGAFRDAALFECRVNGALSGSTIPTDCHIETVGVGVGIQEVMRISTGGNIGINSTAPGQKLDVQGTIRGTGFQLTGNGASSGFVLTSNGVGIGTWVAAGSGSGSGTVNSGTANQVAYYASSTTAVSGSSALIVTGGSSGNNIGIGSATPGSILDVQGTQRIFGNVGIGTANPGTLLDVSGSIRALGVGNTTLNTLSGNVGIGSPNPGQNLDIQGTVRFTGTFLNTTSTTGIGLSIKTGANTACNTTCGTSSCAFGFDTGLGGSDVVNCASALADTCVCAGP